MNALRTYRTLLSNRPLSLLLAGEFVSGIGDWLYLVALLVLVYQESSDPVLLGVVAAARIVPYVVLSVPAGIIVDRFDRRLVLLVTDLARGAIMLALAATVATDGPLALVIALAIGAACFSTFFDPAIKAYIPRLARDETELGPATSAWQTLDNLGFVVGPAIAGVLIATSGLTLAFLLNAATFVVIAAVLWTLPPAKAEKPPTPLEGESTAADEAPLGRLRRPLAGLALVNAAASAAFGGVGLLTVILAVDYLGAGEAGAGFLNTAIGIGGVLGAVAAGALVLRDRQAGPMIAGGIAFGIGLLALGLAPGVQLGALFLAIVGIAAASAGSVLVDVLSSTVFARIVPDHLRGRSHGVIATVGTIAYAAGAIVIPWAVTTFGPGPVLTATALLVVGAAGGAVVLVGPALVRDPAFDEALDRVRRLPLFSVVSPSRLEAALRRFRPIAVVGGDVVIRQGEPADRFYVILDGTFKVTQVGEDGQEAELRTMGPDEVFGEIGLLRGAPRSATVTASTTGRLLALEGPDFLELVGAGGGLAGTLLALRGAEATRQVSAS